MKDFVAEGMWWLPAKPKRRVPGTLRFDTDGAHLTLYEPLRRFVMPKDQVISAVDLEWTVEPVVLGRSHDGRQYTLIEVGGANMKGPLSQTPESYRPRFVVEGCHTNQDRFSQLLCDFDVLSDWAGSPDVTDLGSGQGGIRVRVEGTLLGSAKVPGARIELRAGVLGGASPDRVDLTRTTTFGITPKKGYPVGDLINAYVRPLQDLLTFTLSRPVRLTTIHLRPTRTVGYHFGPGFGELYFEAIQATPAQVEGQANPRSLSGPTILTLGSSSLDLDVLLKRWFRLWEQHRDVLVLLLTPYYAPFLFINHRYATTFQAAEALAGDLVPTKDLSKDKHRERVKAVVEVLDTAQLDIQIVKWAKNILQGRNDKSLPTKIHELTEQTGTVGHAVLSAEPDFAKTVADARTGVSHGGASKTLDPVEHFWYGDVLTWVVRTRLLMELLEDPGRAQSIVSSNRSFQFSLSKLTASAANAKP